MRTLLRGLMIVPGLALGLVCLAATAADVPKPAILPTPKSITMGTGTMPLTAGSRIVVTDPRLDTHAPVVAQEIWLLTDMKLEIAKGAGQAGDIILKINPAIRADQDILAAQNMEIVRTRDMAHTISVTDRAVVEGWDFRAVCEGTATLIQSVGGKPGNYFIPQMKVKDWPFADFTSTMIDCGRQWIPADSLKMAVECARMFKVRYVQVHGGDDQGYGFPSKAFPRLGTQNQDCMDGFAVKRWTWEEMEDLEAFAAARGVGIVPEIETPGHHGAMARCYRDLFDGPGCMDMASEELYQGLDTVIGELCSIFKTAPYFDIGCDECNWGGVGAGPMALVYKRRHAIPRDAQSVRNAHEIYVVHMKRMADICRKYGKLTLAWEDFPRDSRINKDIIALIWYPHAVAQDWQRDGWTTITVPWELGVPFEKWNIFHCNGSTLQRTDKVLGACGPMWQMSRLCVVNGWAQGVSTRSERTWGPDTPLVPEEYQKRGNIARERATLLATPVKVTVEGGLGLGVQHFLTGREIYGAMNDLKVTLSTPVSTGKIHFTRDHTEPTPKSEVYTGPLTLKLDAVSQKHYVLNAALFADGRQIGCVSRHEYFVRDIAGYITDWLIAGPYVEAGKSGQQLYDVAFPPEAGGAAKWIPFKRPAPPEMPWIVGFDAYPGFSGDARVAYLRCQVFSPKAQPALLYVGSDDGVKAFVNGKFVHGVNAGRGVNEEDRAGINLNEGWNQLLIKVNNWTGVYAGKARIRAANDGRLEGLRIKAE